MDACSRYVVSFTRSADDVAAVYSLAEHALGDRAPLLDVVPLFESGADLANAPAVLTSASTARPRKWNPGFRRMVAGASPPVRRCKRPRTPTSRAC